MKLSISLIIWFIISIPLASAQNACGADCDFGVSASEIALYPEPNVKPLVVQDSVLYDRVYRRVDGTLQFYDAPNGNLIGEMGLGYNFVTVGNVQDGWTETSPGKWVKIEQLSDDVAVSRYAGVRLPEDGLPYPMAWLLRHVHPSSAPGADASTDGPMLYRYTRANLYATVEVNGYNWYQINEGQWIHQFDVAKIAPIERPAEVDTDKWIGVDLYEQVLVAYEGTTPVFATLVSSGLSQWSTTEGLFHVYLRYPRTLMSGANNQPDFYYLEEVPWTMYFNGDIALHGTYWHDGFGYRQSHGCVNLSITDAQWLYEWASDEFDFTVENDTGPAVYVYSSGEYK